MANLENLTEKDREQALLVQIAQGGGGATTALLAYLSPPSRVSTNS
jgi:hypothetical protein